MRVLFVMVTLVFAAFQSGTVKFLNADSFSRIWNFITAAVSGEMEITMLPEMIGREVKFDFSQSNVITMCLIVILICVSSLILKKIIKYFRSDTYIRKRNGRARRVKNTYRQIRYFFQRFFFFIKKYAFRIYVYVSSGVFPALDFQSDISITVICDKKRYYGGVKAGTGRQPMVKLSRVIFCGTDAKPFEFPEKGCFIAADKDGGAILHFSKDIETNEGTTHRVCIGRGESKSIRYQYDVKARFSVSEFTINGEQFKESETDQNILFFDMKEASES